MRESAMIIYKSDNLRISLITDRLIRTELGSFTDLPTQTVQNRDFCEVKYELSVKVGNVNKSAVEKRTK